MSSIRQVLGGILRFKGNSLVNTTSNAAGCVGSFLQARNSHNVRPKLYPKEHVVTLIPGDGVWPELIAYVREVLERCGAPVRFEEVSISELRKSQIQGATLEDALASLKRNRVCLKGILRSSVSFRASELESLNMKLRRQADLFAHVVHIRSLPGVSTRHGEDLDFYIIRDQAEGSYSVLEHETVPGIVESLKVVTRANSERIAKFAFDLATKFNRKRVTAVHKANIMKLTDGLFLESCARVAKLYPFIKFDSMIIDNCCMQLVARPRQFDVLVMGNLYGNIIDNLAAGLVGGAGVVPGASYSHDLAVFETGARHPFATAVGRNIANPTAILLSAADMLRHLNASAHADCIERAVKSVIQQGQVRTQDLGGYATTSDFVHAVIDKLDMA